MNRIRFVVEVDTDMDNPADAEYLRRRLQNAIGMRYGHRHPVVTVGAMPARLRCACGCCDEAPCEAPEFCHCTGVTSQTGVDQNWGPDKVWRCDECGLIANVGKSL